MIDDRLPRCMSRNGLGYTTSVASRLRSIRARYLRARWLASKAKTAPVNDAAILSAKL